MLLLARDWYGDRGVPAVIEGSLDEAGQASLERAVAEGFDLAFAFPSPEQQISGFATALAALAPDSELHVDLGEAAIVGHPSGSYLLLIRSDASEDDDLRGLTAPALRKQLASAQDTTLTAHEYVVLQRCFYEQHGDHRFDDYQGDPPGWMWLADTEVGDRTAMADWYAPNGRVDVTACKTGSKNPRKGARRTRIIPLVAGRMHR